MSEPQHTKLPPSINIPPELATRLSQLGLTDTVQHAEENGFGYIYQPDSDEFNQRLREVVLRVGTSKRSANLLLDKDPIFEEVVLNPKLLAIAEAMCGEGALLSQYTCSVRGKGARALPLHADQNWTPAPFPDANQLVTFCWACDEFTKAGGATMAVPKSHVHRRHPTASEVTCADDAIALECPAGTIPFWDGSVWHGNWPRTIDEQRVVLHITFCRSYLRQLENYSYLDDAWFDQKDPQLQAMVGR